jgi:hypothetical protein
MVEIQFFPAASGMTLFTIFPITATVDVIQLVAGKTLDGCLGIVIADMTAGAISFSVTTSQAKMRFVVIVMNLTPFVFVMAAATLV